MGFTGGGGGKRLGRNLWPGFKYYKANLSGGEGHRRRGDGGIGGGIQLWVVDGNGEGKEKQKWQKAVG